jgi:hypothetical protein
LGNSMCLNRLHIIARARPCQIPSESDSTNRMQDSIVSRSASRSRSASLCRSCFSIFIFYRTSKVTHGCPWRDPCRERSDQARSVTRVDVESTALFAFFSYHD